MNYSQYDPHHHDAKVLIEQIRQNSKKLFPYNDRKQPAYYYTVARLCYTLAALKSIFDLDYNAHISYYLVQEQIDQYLNYQLPTPNDQMASPTLTKEYQLKFKILKELTETQQGLKDALVVTKQMLDE